MPAVDQLLADLAAHPPSEPTPVGEIWRRARRRARRRRALVSAAAVLVVAAAGVGVGAAATGGDPADELVAGGGLAPSAPLASGSSTTSAPPSSSTASIPVASGDPTMTLTPASGFQDGSVVRMSLDEPASGPAIMLQCTAEAEAFGGSPEILPWCTGLVEARAEALQPFVLSRTVDTPDGEVDCAEAVGRCTLSVRVGDVETADLRTAALAFQSTPPVEPTVVVDGDEGTVGDGDTLLVTVTGVETGDVIHVQQCRRAAGDELGSSAACDEQRARTTSVESGPETQLTFTAFHDLYVDTDEGEGDAPGWAPCQPCEVVVWAGEAMGPVARLPLEMEPVGTPIRPAVVLDPGGPHTWGEEVDVRVTGLQPNDSVPIGWCPTVAPQGGGGTACWSGDGDVPVEYPVAADGTVLVEDFALPQPGSFVGTDCAVPGACGVGVDGGDSASIVAVVPLDLTG